MSSTTPSAIHHVKWMNANPPRVRTRRISSVAYDTEDMASLAKTGRAIFLGSNVPSRRSLRMGRPTKPRLSTLVMTPTQRNATSAERWLCQDRHPGAARVATPGPIGTGHGHGRPHTEPLEQTGAPV